MADTKISALSAGSALAGTEEIPVVQSAATVKTTPAAIKTYVEKGGTVTTDDPVLDLTQTWNNGAVTFTGVLINVTNTASNSASLLHDWQVGGVSKANIRASDGKLTTAGAIVGSGLTMGQTSSGQFTSRATGAFGFSSDTTGIAAQDTSIYRDAAGVLAQRVGTAAQTSRVYGTYTDASNYVRGSLAATSTAVTLAAETAGTGADNVPVIINPAGTSQVEVGNGVQFTEMTAPSAPAANKVILFAQDNGAGKTQLMALFPSGAAQQVAIEP